MTSTKSGIYQLTNTQTGTTYFGSSANLRQRKSQHWSHFRNDNHPNQLLRADCQKYGMDAFKFAIIEEVSPDRLYEVEQTIIVIDDEHYNIAPFAHGGNGGHSMETLAKIGAANRDKRHTPEACAKISRAMKNRVFTEDHLRNITEANRRNAKHQHPDKGRHIREAKSMGTYHTPWGDFLSPNEAAAACPLRCSSHSIRRYCIEGTSVTKQAFTRNEWLAAQGDQVLGRDFAELGFSFTPKNPTA